MIIVLLIPVTSVFASGGNDFITYEVTLDNLTMDYASVGGRFDHQHSLINQ